jgi:queuine tRNA-ribosyltransferase
MFFKVTARDRHSAARTGMLQLPHGAVATPVFMPVGTAGTVKAVHFHELESLDYRLILGNSYHLYLRPGATLLQQCGGLRGLNGWQHNLLTDSGGYQVYSLSANRKITEEGVSFQSHIDGSKHLFTPENVMQLQRIIGADVVMAFDECPPYPCDQQYAMRSMHLTHRWLKRCKTEFENSNDGTQHLFPIVQGSVFPELRRQSAEEIAAADFDGNAIGGLSVGEPAELMYDMTGLVCEILPAHKPRYLMGVGTPSNILECIALGIDMFDCVLPTRNGRNGTLYTQQGILNIRNAKWKDDLSPVDEQCSSAVVRECSKGYLHHLFRSNELLGLQIASLCNLALYSWLMQEAKNQIAAGNYFQWKNSMTVQLMKRL